MKLYRTFILAIFAMTLIACGGAEERKAVYMEKAKSSIEAGDLDKARIELKNVLQIDPKDSEAYYQLGKLYEQRQDYRKAFANYKKAEELNPDLLENQAKLGRIYLILAKDFEKAQEKIDLILAKDSNNAEGLLLKAAMLMKKEERIKALDIAESVVVNNPDHVGGAAFLATLYFTDKNNEDAIKVLDVALKNNQDNEQLNKLLAVILVNDKDFERAEVVYNRFLERNPDSSASYNNLAVFYNQTGDKEKAEVTLRNSIENDPSDIDRQLMLIKFIKAAEGNNEAIKETKALISKNNSLGKLRTLLAELYLLNDNKDLAMDIYLDVINDFSEEHTGIAARISLANIYIRDKNYSKATEIIDEAVNISPNDPKVNLLRAKLALQEKDVEKAIISLRIVTKETPENIEAYLLLANTYKLENNAEQLMSTLNSAYENSKTNPDALLKLAQYVISSDVVLAEKIVDDYNKLKETNYEGLSMKAAILNQKKEFSGAYEIAKVLMKMYPDKPTGYLQSIPYLSQKGDKQKAISTLEKGYINSKNNRKLLLLLTTIQVSDKQYDIVKKRVNEELNASPDDPELKILLAKVTVASNDIKNAILLFEDVISTNPDIEEPYLLLAQMYLNAHDFKSAKSIYIKGKSNIPASIKIPLRLAATFELDKDYQNAIDIYRELHNQYPDNLIVINNLASMLSDYGDNNNDLVLANKLIIRLKESEQPVFLDTIGWVHYKSGDYQNAIKFLKQVLEKSPKINVFNYHLGMAYKMNGDKAQAKDYLDKSLADGKEFKEKDLAKAALKDL